jgi:hypothetical protein
MTVTGAVLVPYLLMWFVAPFVSVNAGSEWPFYVALISPATIIVANEFGEASLGMTCANFAFYGILLLGVRQLNLRHADRLLGRAESGRMAPIAETETPAFEEMVTA